MIQKLLLICALIYVSNATERPRGVSFAMASFYQPGKDFTCITSGEIVLWEYVNDDYCDCTDGSDEPGTSACNNGHFYCENRGHRGENLVSSRVNDGICDCCDGSDEFDDRIKCVNTCEELGRREREEREAMQKLQEQGYKIRQDYIQQGKRAREEKRARLTELENHLPELTQIRDDLKIKKDEAEAPEREAIESHKKAWEEYKAGREAERDRVAAIHAYADLDVNSDRAVDYVEMQRHIEFDIDSDGTVSVEEAKEYLDENDFVDLEKFHKIWPNIKDIYKVPAYATTPPPASQDKNDDEEEEDEDFEEDEVDEDEGKDEEEEEMPPYNEATQKKVEVADTARNHYHDADGQVQDKENEIKDLKKYLETDFGPEEEYSGLYGQCFEFSDREYTYKLCPFDRTAQKPKAGGMETSLGKWGHWYGPEEDKYDAMKYEKGQNCWNGPKRSTHVNLHCGTENQVTAASEPSRCEYQFEFTTPARCKHFQPPATHHEHTEL